MSRRSRTERGVVAPVESEAQGQIAEYCQCCAAGQYRVVIYGIGWASPDRVSDRPLLQARVDEFWNALREGRSVETLVPLFDSSLSLGVCEEILARPNAAMAALSDYDLRFDDPVARPRIYEIVCAWLDKNRAKTPVRKTRAAKTNRPPTRRSSGN